MKRRGAIAFVTCIAMFFLASMMAVLIANAGLVHRKLSSQSAADDSVQAAGTVAARAMNSLIANQHLMGEMLAVEALIMGYGGIELAEGKLFMLEKKPAMVTAYGAACVAAYYGGFPPPDEKIFTYVTNPLISKSGASIGESRNDLMAKLTEEYVKHASGDWQRSLVEQAKIFKEWMDLEKLEKHVEKNLVPLKGAFNQAVNELYIHNRAIVSQTPANMEKAVIEMGERKKIGTTRLLEYKLPVKEEKRLVKQNGWERSQAVRAITPWVQYWRKPILEKLAKQYNYCDIEKHYLKFTQKFTLLMPDWQSRDFPVENWFFVLEDCDFDKGSEPWTKRGGSKRADQLFCFLSKADFKGKITYSQEMIYGANPQEPEKPGYAPKWQRVAGWDTLQWDDAVKVPEFKTGNKPDDGNEVKQPRIKLNWRTKLTPATRANEAAGQGGDPLWLQITH